MKQVDPEILDWSKGQGLLPAIVQHAHTGRVLMLGFVSREALERSYACGNAVFYSRTRECLWMKGETSGNTLKLVSVEADCDNDTLLMLAEPAGPTCHNGTTSCFAGSRPFLDYLDALVATRLRERPAGSYTTQLAETGVAGAAQKVGEEAVELALAAVGESDERVADEAADLLFHMLVALRQRDIALHDVIEVLARRHADAG